ncbi:MAG: hypothetical protein E6G60_16945 [Actinobacteria bacterium]|nr:MAG: hypothetical protein E6G60_16945 [Actinomycetota bacterium]
MADRSPARSLTVRAARARRRAALVARAVGVAGVAALGLSSALVVWAAVRSPHRYGGLIALLGASAVVVIAAGAAARRLGACGTGVAVVGAMFVVSQVDRGASIAAPVVFGCGLLIVLELTAYAVVASPFVTWEPSARRRRWAERGGVVVAGFFVALVVSVIGTEGQASTRWLFLAAAGAAVGVIGFAIALVGRTNANE